MSRYETLKNQEEQSPLMGGHQSLKLVNGTLPIKGEPATLNDKLKEIVANYCKTAYEDNAEQIAAEQYAKTGFSYTGCYQKDASNSSWTRFKNWAKYQLQNLRSEEQHRDSLAKAYHTLKQDAQTMRHLMALCERQARLCPSMLPQTNNAFDQLYGTDNTKIIKILHFQFQNIERALFFQLQDKVSIIAAELVKELMANNKKLPQGLNEAELKTVIEFLLIGGNKKTGYIKKQLDLIRDYNKDKNVSAYLKIGALLTDCEYHAKRIVKEQQQIKDNLRSYKRDINRFAQDLDVDFHIVQINKSDKASNKMDGAILKFERVAQWLADNKPKLTAEGRFDALQQAFISKLATLASEEKRHQLKAICCYEETKNQTSQPLPSKTEAELDAIFEQQNFFASDYRAMYLKEHSSKTKQSDNINISLSDVLTFLPKLLVYSVALGFGALEFIGKCFTWPLHRNSTPNINWTRLGARLFVKGLSWVVVGGVATGIATIETGIYVLTGSLIGAKSMRNTITARFLRSAKEAINNDSKNTSEKAAARAKKSWFRFVANQGSVQVGITQGSTSFVGFNLFFAALVPMIFISLPLALLVGMGAALCNTILVRQDTYDTLKKFFLGGLFINDDGEYVLNIDPKSPKWSYVKAAFRVICMVIVAAGSIGCGFSYGALAFSAMIKSIITPLFNLLALKVSAIIPTLFAAIPAIATMIGLTALFFVVAADFVVNFSARCKSIWNYFKTTYGINWDSVNDICVKYHTRFDFKVFGITVRPLALSIALGSYVLGIVSNLAKLAIAVTFCLIYTTACFGSFYASGRALMLAVSTSSWSSIMVTVLTYSNAVITGAFGLQKNLDFVDGISIGSIVTFIPKLAISIVGLAAVFIEKVTRAVTQLSLFTVGAATQIAEMPFKLIAIGLNKLHLFPKSLTPSIKSSLTHLFPSKWMPSLLPKLAPAATRWLLKPFDNVGKLKVFNKTIWKPTNHQPIAKLVPADDTRPNSKSGQSIAKMHRIKLQHLWDMLMGCVSVNMVGQMLLFGGDKDAQKTTSTITHQSIAGPSIIVATTIGSGGPNGLASKASVDSKRVPFAEVTSDSPQHQQEPTLEHDDVSADKELLYPLLPRDSIQEAYKAPTKLTPSKFGMFAIPKDVLESIETEVVRAATLYT